MALFSAIPATCRGFWSRSYAHGVTIRLEPFSEAHLSLFERLRDDPAVVRYTRLPEQAPPDFARAWLSRYEQGRRDGTREVFAIVDGDECAVGFAAAVAIDREAATAELGYVVAAEARGRGIASRALSLLTDWGFRDLGAERLELLISVDNEPSKRVAGRCGYIREGVLRSFSIKPGVREDMEIWSRLATD
jgi:RimJ/RimL family protein N-acetyltransferase